ncbi:MAG TPA: hypothetical protein VIX82_00110 [Solirubrobacteraceae bacterium]
MTAHSLAAAFQPVDQHYLLQARQMQALSFAVHIPLVAFGISFPAMVLFVEWSPVLAAAAIPGELAPVRRGDHLLVDGGVVNNTPISHAVELGAERIYILPTQDPANRSLANPPRGALDAAVHAMRLTVDARLQVDLARYADHVELILLPAANPSRVQPTDFDHADVLIRSALVAARAALNAAAGPRRIAV